jgi:hypothetical protein
MPSVYKVNDGENIFDTAIATYGSLELVYKIILDNPQLDNIDTELTSLPGLVLQYDETFQVEEEQGEKQIQLPAEKKVYIVQEGQSLYDLALILYGNPEGVFQIVKDNLDIFPNINQNLLGGMEVKFVPALNGDQVFTKYLDKNDLIINTSDPKVNFGSGFSFGFRFESFY